MYIARVKTYSSTGKLSHTAILLRRSFRVKGKGKSETIANLTHCSEQEIAAIEWALKNKANLHEIQNTHIRRKASKQFGAVYLVNEVMKKLGIDKALGNSLEGKLAKFQVISRTINQCSCLSSVRMASEQQAIFEVLSIEEKISEDNLYKNLHWLCQQQSTIERKLFKERYKDKEPEIFLYDVTSSYFEGTQNALANWGYNRDKKKGKMQVVAGLLCDEDGYPLAIRLFEGNTLDFNTVSAEIKQVAEEFGCRRVTFVSDRGMLKSKQIAELTSVDFYYITAITKPQIDTLLKSGVIQMSLFDNDIQEVNHEGVRYILRRNPVRAKELEHTRSQKRLKIDELLQKKNEYLKDHPKSKPEKAIKEISVKIKKLKLESWLKIEQIENNSRELTLIEDTLKLMELSQLDGCYVIKSNLPETVSKTNIHDRYKDLKYVEQDFRSMKTDWLEIRPWYVRTEPSTRGHAFIAMLSYMIVKTLREMWKDYDITVEEGIKLLNGLSLLEVKLNGEIQYLEVPEPSEMMTKLLTSAGVRLPEILPYKKVNVSSRVKLKREA